MPFRFETANDRWKWYRLSIGLDQPDSSWDWGNQMFDDVKQDYEINHAMLDNFDLENQFSENASYNPDEYACENCGEPHNVHEIQGNYGDRAGAEAAGYRFGKRPTGMNSIIGCPFCAQHESEGMPLGEEGKKWNKIRDQIDPETGGNWPEGF